MIPNKLMRHLSYKHSNLTKKSQKYFIKLLGFQKEQSKTFVEKVTIFIQIQEARFLDAELIAKEIKPHTIRDIDTSSLFSNCKRNVEPDVEAEIKKISLLKCYDE